MVSKLAAADVVIWLDDVAFSKNGWTNRNRLPSQAYLTIPIEHRYGQLIREVELSQPEANRSIGKIVRTLRQEYAGAEHYDDRIADWLERSRGARHLLPVNRIALALLLDGLRIDVDQRLQSRLVGVSPAPNVSAWLAHAVNELGGDTYLSGPSGRRYLDLAAFARRGVAVRFFEHDGPNFSAVHDLFVHGRLTV